MADEAIGLVKNALGVAFQCGTCEYYGDGKCHHPLPKLNGKKVAPSWCCNHYEHDGMQVITQ